jgi:hypothetical protein
MNLAFGLVSGIALFILASMSGCATSTTRSEARTGGEAAIVRVEGSADLFRAGNWAPARVGETLHQGDQARTAANGKIEINLGNYGGVLTLTPDSLLRLEQLGPTSPEAEVLAIVDLRRGRVIGDTLKPPARKTILIRTPTGTQEIR